MGGVALLIRGSKLKLADVDPALWGMPRTPSAGSSPHRANRRRVGIGLTWSAEPSRGGTRLTCEAKPGRKGSDGPRSPLSGQDRS